MIMLLGDPGRALKGDDDEGLVCRQGDHDRRVVNRGGRRGVLDGAGVRVSADGVQYGHEGRHHGIGTPDCPRDLHHHHDERCEPPGAAGLADRRQRAREAFWDRLAPPPIAANGTGGVTECLDEAIETATRVRLTREIFDAFFAVKPSGDPDNPNWREPIAAAFRAAGFEIEE